MKYLLILLLSFCAFAQTDSINRTNISLISAERLNVVYRGIDNPIKIAVPGAVSFAVSAPGIKRGTGQGNYILNPGQGNEVNVMISATMPDGKLISEEKVFKVRAHPVKVPTINGEHCENCIHQISKNQLTTLKIGYVLFPDCPIYDIGEVTSFDMHIPGYKMIHVSGNKFDSENLKLLNQQKSGTKIIIFNLKAVGGSIPVGSQQVSPIQFNIL